MSRIVGPDVYVDANALIYFVEGFAAYAGVLRPLFAEFDRGTLRGVTSEITLAESLVKPMRDGDVKTVDTYMDLLSPTSTITTLPVSRQVLIEAASLRSRQNVKLPDAIHLATASLRGCNTVITNDRGMAGHPGLNVVLLSDLAGSP